VFVEHQHHRDRPRAPIGEVLVHEIEMLVAIEESEGEPRGTRHEGVEPGLDAHRVATPVGTQHEEMPGPVERLHPRDEIGGDLRPGSDRLLERDVLGVGRGGEPGVVREALLETIEKRRHP